MKLKVVTTSHTTENAGWKILKASLERFGYDYTHIMHPFSFGHQLLVVREWCNAYQGDCTHILYTDCFDTIAFADAHEVTVKSGYPWIPGRFKMIISGEKNCYPHPERAKDYPETHGPWKYVNGGGWLVEIEYFKQLCIKENLNDKSHDQVWLMEAFLNNQDKITIDTKCQIFQTIAFSNQDEWSWYFDNVLNKDRPLNTGTGTCPVFFHGNGHTEMNWLYEHRNVTKQEN